MSVPAAAPRATRTAPPRNRATGPFRSTSSWRPTRYARYRSVKNTRDGRPLAARLDAADSARHLLELLFTLERRPRPYNKYLCWELARHPLPGWAGDELPAAVDRITCTGDAGLQRAVFARVEPAARRAGHGGVLDAWGEDLHLMRPPQT